MYVNLGTHYQNNDQPVLQSNYCDDVSSQTFANKACTKEMSHQYVQSKKVSAFV